METGVEQVLRINASTGVRSIVSTLPAVDSYGGITGGTPVVFIIKTNTPDSVLRVNTSTGVVTVLSSNAAGDGLIFGTGLTSAGLGQGIAVVPGSASTAPTVTSPTSGAITANAATLGGNVTGDGGAAVTTRGVVLSPTATNNNPLLGGGGVVNLTTMTMWWKARIAAAWPTA
jgi:hypothetical protein